jgi:hypothetical protein
MLQLSRSEVPVKKLIWTALAALTSTAAAALAIRALNYTWRRVTHEPPPEQPKWARLLVGMPVKKGVKKAVASPV